MVDWNDPAAILASVEVLESLTIALLGLFGYEYILTLSFEWKIITRKIAFKWPYIFYFLSRYCMLFSLVLTVIVQRSPRIGHCKNLVPSMTPASMLASAFATTNLVTRTVVLWRHNILIVLSLISASLAQNFYLMLVGAIAVKGQPDPMGREGCIVLFTSHPLSASTIFITSIYDFIILVLTIVAVSRIPGKTSKWKILSQQGLYYFLFTFLINVPAMIFFLLNLNPPLGAIFAIPAATVSSLLSCRMVVSLIDTRPEDLKPTVVTAELQGRTTNGRSSTRQVLSSHLDFPTALYGVDQGSSATDLEAAHTPEGSFKTEYSPHSPNLG